MTKSSVYPSSSSSRSTGTGSTGQANYSYDRKKSPEKESNGQNVDKNGWRGQT